MGCCSQAHHEKQLVKRAENCDTLYNSKKSTLLHSPHNPYCSRSGILCQPLKAHSNHSSFLYSSFHSKFIGACEYVCMHEHFLPSKKVHQPEQFWKCQNRWWQHSSATCSQKGSSIHYLFCKPGQDLSNETLMSTVIFFPLTLAHWKLWQKGLKPWRTRSSKIPKQYYFPPS